jgi:hypothetical protein
VPGTDDQPHAVLVSGRERDRVTDPDAEYLDVEPDCHTHAPADAHRQPDAHAHADAVPDPDTDPRADPSPDGSSHPPPDGAPHGVTHADPDPGPDPDAAKPAGHAWST